MIDTPDYESTVASTREALKDQFAFAHRLYDAWMLVEKNRYIRESTFDPLVVRLANTLNVQACRQYRSVVDLCERCEATNAMIVARSLYETAVALMFVLAPAVHIQAKPKNGKPDAWQSVPGQPPDSLSNHLRARLYVSNIAFGDERFYLKWKDDSEFQQMAQLVKPDPALIAFCEREVGKEWSYILNHRPHTYSGLSLAELVKVLGNRLDTYYGTLYHFLSRMAHAADAIRHASDIGGNIGPQWLSRVDEVDGALQAGSQVFLASVTILQNEFGFGPETDKTLDGLVAGFHSVFA